MGQAVAQDTVFTNALGEAFTLAQAHALFSAVENASNWKLPVDAMLPWAELSRLGGVEAMRKAVEFYTGSVCRVDDMGQSVRVRAAGYYAACGA